MSKLCFLLLFIFLFPPLISAQDTPTLDNFAPLTYPCISTDPFIPLANPEFHPLRPYPASPCDPLIPRKDPEAPSSTDPDKMYLTFMCGKSINVSGTSSVTDVFPICNIDILPDPIPPLPPDTPESGRYRCDATTGDICYIKRVYWTVTADLSSTQLPIMGNTEDDLSRAQKVNHYLSWYLNGTVLQSLQRPLDVSRPGQVKQLTTFSGPLNKLLPQEWSNNLKRTLAENLDNNNTHNYFVSCRQDVNAMWIASQLWDVLYNMAGLGLNAIRLGLVIGYGVLQNPAQFIAAAIEIDYHIITGDLTEDLQRQIWINHGITAISTDVWALRTINNFNHAIMSNITNIVQSFNLNNVVDCESGGDRWRLSNIADTNWDGMLPYVPYGTVEDTDGEFTMSLIPGNQPVSPDISGQILSIGLSINNGSDSRLYYPHMRSSLALSEILTSLNKPLITPTLPPVDPTDPQLGAQRVSQHQGPNPPVPGGDDDTQVQVESEYNYPYPYSEIITRNTEVREGNPAPTPLYDADAVCDISDVRSNMGDSLKPGPTGTEKSVIGFLVYDQLVRYTPQVIIQCQNQDCPSEADNCVNEPCRRGGDGCVGTELEYSGGRHNNSGCCYDHCPVGSYCKQADANNQCVRVGNTCPMDFHEVALECGPDDPGQTCCAPNTNPEFRECVHNLATPWPCYVDCESITDPVQCDDTNGCCYSTWDPGYVPVPNPGYCPEWPNTNITSGARVNVFTKTPFAEKVYDTLIDQPQSFFRRWLPKLPLTPSDTPALKSGRDDTVPGRSVVSYSGSTEDPYGLDTNSTSAGNGGGGALYFPHLGSLSDYLLGMPSGENLNLQRLLRPKGFMPAVGTAPPGSSGDINCNQGLPEHNVDCIDRDNYFSIAHRPGWASHPEGAQAEICYDDVIHRTEATDVSPNLSLLVWLNESNTSNYLSLSPVEDFGIHTGQWREPDNFDGQITGFLYNTENYRSVCSGLYSQCMADPSEDHERCGAMAFAAWFSQEGTPACNRRTTATDRYANDLYTVWDWINGGDRDCRRFPFP